MSDISWGMANPNIAGSVMNAFMQGQSHRQNLAASQQRQTFEAQDQQWKAEDRTQAQGDRAKKEQLEFVTSTADALGRAVAAGKDPLQAWDETAPIISQVLKAPPEQVAQFRELYAKNPQAFLQTMTAQARKELEIINMGGGVVGVFDKSTGAQVQQHVAPYMTLGEGQTAIPNPLYQPPTGQGQMAPQAPQAAPQGAAPMAGAPQGQDGFEAFVDALTQVESGGRVGVPGPPTQYGTANGLMQVLDTTGEAVAKQLGVPWRPDLMRDKSPEGAAYQKMIGTAYAKEAWDAAGGDPKVAAMYYHGGPNRAIWGPKTQAHGEKVVARLGMSGSVGQDTMTGQGAPSGLPVLRGQPKPVARWEQIDPGRQRNTETGEIKSIPGSAAELKALERQEKAKAAMEMQAGKAQQVIAIVEDAKKILGRGEAGFVGKRAAAIEGTKAYDLAKMLETVKANLGFAELQAMRQSSPTGGALGQVAVQELIALQSTVANLDQGQSEGQLRANLDKIGRHYKRWLKTVEAAAEGKTEIARDGSRESPYRAGVDKNIPEGAFFVARNGQIYRQQRQRQREAPKTAGKGWKIVGVE